MNSKIMMMAFVMLISIGANAGYLPTDIIFKQTLSRLSLSGSVDHNSSHKFDGVMLSLGGRIFAIDAKSDKSVLSYIGHQLCDELSKSSKKKLKFAGDLAYGYGPQGNGTLLLTAKNNKMFAELVPSKLMIVGIGCAL